MFTITSAWEEGSEWGNAAAQQKTDHTWSINPNPSGAVSQKDWLYTLIKTAVAILVHWIPSRLLTPSAYGKSLIQLSSLPREIQSEPKPAMDR